MREIRFLIFVFLVILMPGLGRVYAQTYTSNSNGNWNSASTWTITNTTGCGASIPTTPPLGTNNRPCPVVVIINHNVSRSGNLTIGNNNTVSIQIAANRTLTLEDNFDVSGNNNKNLSISGDGTLEIEGDLNISGNSVANFSGNLTVDVGESINITQASQFLANGTLQFSAEEITIDGNGSLNFQALGQSIFESTNGDINIQDGSNVLFSGSSGILSDEEINITGNTPAVRFEDNSFLEASRDIFLENGSTLNLEDDSRMISGRDVIMEDQSDLNLSNSSTLQIGRNLELSNTAFILASGSSEIMVAGELILDDQSTISMNGTSSIEVNEETTVTTDNLANGLRFNGNASGIFNSSSSFDGNSSTLYTSENATVEFNGSVTFEGGGDIFITGDSKLTFNSTTRIRGNGTTFNTLGNPELIFVGNVSLESQADVILANNSDLTLRGNLSFDNHSSTTWTNTQSATVFIEGNFSKGSNSYLTVSNSGAFEICAGTFPLQSSDSRIIIDPTPAYYGGCRILPVEYLSFTSSFNSFQRSGELTWATAKEWENSHFEIERSVNDIQSWILLDQISGAGYSDKPMEYAFVDNSLPASGGNVFYRLKQVDFNGNFTYSITRSIQINPIKGKGAWIAYPNPSAVGNAINIDLLNDSEYQDEPIFVQISDIRGRGKAFTVNEPEEVTQHVNAYLNQCTSGIYIVLLRWGNQRQQLKLIKK